LFVSDVVVWLTEMILHGRYHIEDNEDARLRNPRWGKLSLNPWMGDFVWSLTRFS